MCLPFLPLPPVHIQEICTSAPAKVLCSGPPKGAAVAPGAPLLQLAWSLLLGSGQDTSEAWLTVTLCNTSFQAKKKAPKSLPICCN